VSGLPFDHAKITSTELKASGAALDALSKTPMCAFHVHRHGKPEGVLVSTKLWEILCEAALGHTLLLEVPLDEHHAKTVVARREQNGNTNEGVEWTVLVDELPYALRHTSGDLTPDMSQLIWRHHADVAQAIVSRHINDCDDTMK
jgi:hypothetical protein